ncbi:MAG: hypothetical protein LBU69_05605, partial [Deltaproteobacteria bacterium]|nr:hypothetical protein [Deltaproteobacteria bacterium]
RETGFDPQNVKVLKNGQRLKLFPDGECKLGTPINTGRMLVDGNRLGQADDPVIRNRISLAEMGLVYVILVLGPGLSLATRPRINIHALQYEDEPDLALEAASIAQKTLADWRDEQIDPDYPNLPNLLDSIKRDVRKLFKHTIKRKPLIFTEVIFLDPIGQSDNN